MSGPLDAVVSVVGNAGDGSGVLISADEVLTASHVVWDSRPRYIMETAATVDIGGHRFNGVVTHYHQIVDDPGIALEQSQSDYALIHLERPVIGITPWAVNDGSFGYGSVTISGYPASAGGQRVDLALYSSWDIAYPGLMDARSIGAGSSGGPMWFDGKSGPEVVGIASSGWTDGPGYYARMTTSAADEVRGWIAVDHPAPAHIAAVLIHDTTTNTDMVDILSQLYAGPVAGIQTQFVDITTDSLSITATAPSMFIHTGSGNDAVALLSGINVVDGGTGSNFLTGGTGTDTFFVDARGAAADTWSTVNAFHSGDAATLWGVAPSSATLAWSDGGGAAGYTGLTLHATAAGHPTASLTLAGYSTVDLAGGKLTASYGSVGGSDYLYVHAT